MRPNSDTTQVLDERQSESRLAEDERGLVERIEVAMAKADEEEGEEDGR